MADRPKFDPQAEYAPTQFDPNGEIESAQKPVPAQPAYDPYNGALKSHWDATKYGMKEFGGGVADVAKGMYDLIRPPEEDTLASRAKSAYQAPVKMAEGLYGLGKQALQVPGAISDLAHSSDPLGHIGMAAPRAGGQAAGTLLAAEGPKAISDVPVGRVMRTAGKVAADLPVAKSFAKIPDFYEATSPEAELMNATRKAVRNKNANYVKMRVKPEVPGTPGSSPVGTIAQPEVNILPEPRQPFSGENEGYMASVPREELSPLAGARKPGAGAQLQQLGKPVLYVPNEAGYPGPRSTTLIDPYGQPIKPVSGGSMGAIELPPSSPTSPMSRPLGGSGGLNPNATPPKPTAVPAPEYDPAVSAEDVGTKARKGVKEMSRAETEKRARVRTPEELAHNDAWRQARKELGDDASSEDIERRVEELKKKVI